jgi:hypothetical protein
MRFRYKSIKDRHLLKSTALQQVTKRWRVYKIFRSFLINSCFLVPISSLSIASVLSGWRPPGYTSAKLSNPVESLLLPKWTLHFNQ